MNVNEVAINVCVRVRPFNQREIKGGELESALSVERDTVVTKTSPINQFHFDHVLDQNSATLDVYGAVAHDVVEASLTGVNGTIFAYGQTSTGKTHTMFGTQGEPGIMPLAVHQIFDHIANTPQREYILRVSYMEIYNEIIKDLLKPGNDNLKIHQNPNGEIFVGDLEEHNISSIGDVHRLISMGDGNRHIGETNMNEKSSRSHTIFRMVIESRAVTVSSTSEGGGVKVSLLNLVDLAGSERVSSTGAEGIRLKEGGHINKSLLALGTVIAKLSDEKDRSHIPYRDSKLTRILQSSLGGNARTGIVCTVTPAAQHIDETLSTLRFANRAKNITNRPQVNEIITDDNLLKMYRLEIEELKKRLVESEERKANYSSESFASSEMPSPELQSHRISTSLESAEFKSMKCRMAENQKDYDTLTKKWTELKEYYDFALMERDSLKIALDSKKRQLSQAPNDLHPNKKSKSNNDESFIERNASFLSLTALTSALSENYDENLSSLVVKVNSLQSSNLSTNVKLLCAEKKYESVQLNVDDLEKQLMRHKIDAQEAEQKYRDIVEESERGKELYNAEKMQMQSKFDITASENAELKSQLDSHLSQNQDLLSEIAELKRLHELHEQQHQNSELLKFEMNEIKKTNDSLYMQRMQHLVDIDVLVAENRELKDQKVSLKNAEHDLKLSSQNMEGVIQSLSKEVGAYKAICKKIEEELHCATLHESEVIKGLQLEMELLRKEHEEKDTANIQEVFRLKNSLSEKEQQVSELVLMLENLNVTLESARSKLDFQDGQLTQSQFQFDELNSQNDILKADLTQARSLGIEKGELLKRACFRLIHFLPAFCQLVFKFSLIEKRIFDMENARFSTENQIDVALESNHALQLQLSELHEKYLLLSEEFDVSRNDLDNNLKESENIIDALNVTVSDKDAHISLIERKLLQVNESFKVDQSRISDLEKENNEKSIEILKYDQEVQSISEECDILRCNVTSLKKQLEDFQSKEAFLDHSKIIEELQEQIILLKRQSERDELTEPQKFDPISRRKLTEKNIESNISSIPKKQRANRLKQRNEETGDCKQQ